MKRTSNVQALTSGVYQAIEGNFRAFWFDDTNGGAMNRLLVIVMLLMSPVSIYTTQGGMRCYMPPLLAVSSTVGVQFLLLAAALLLAKKSEKKKGAVAYGIGVAISVFFSFAMFLDTINPDEVRRRDARGELAAVASLKFHSTLDEVEVSQKSALLSYKVSLAKWRDDSIEIVFDELKLATAAHDLGKRSAEEHEIAFQAASKNGLPAWKLKPLKDENAAAQKRQREYKAVKERLEGKVQVLSDVVTNMIANAHSVTHADFEHAVKACRSLLKGGDEKTYRHCSSVRDVAGDIGHLNDISQYWEVYSYGCDFGRHTDWLTVDGCIESAPIGHREKRLLRGEISDLVADPDNDPSMFEFSVKALFSGQPHAILSLVLAVMFDALLLIAGFLRIRPEHGISDADQSDFVRILEADGEGSAALKLSRVLSSAEPYIAEEGYTVVVSLSAFGKAKGLAGTLQAGGWAMLTNIGDEPAVILSDTFVRWAADKVDAGKGERSVTGQTVSLGAATGRHTGLS